MRHVDFSPLYRSTVGFDRLFTMLDSLAQPESGQTYPPYNIERTGEDAYRISMAVAGFSDERDLDRSAPQRADRQGRAQGREQWRRHRSALSRHRRARLRAPLPACRPRRGRRRRAEERPAAHRSQAQHSGGAEAAQDRDRATARPKAKQIEAKAAPKPSLTPAESRAAPSGAAFLLCRDFSRSARRTRRRPRRSSRSW